ncbi:MAG TPA: cytidylate kinase-like family protein [Treponemataceae bacterium]|nr:cytidylate kinase-like family protein [Treponemataceae bacterium]
MSVITISREAGSLGTDIAQAVAASLSYKLVNKETLGTLLAKYGLVGFSKVYDAAPDFWEGFNARKVDERTTMIAMMNRAILAIAKRGNVIIVGRGGYVALSGYADALNVRLQAPIEFRAKAAMTELGLSDLAAAEKDVRERDRVRALFMETFYGIKTEPVSSFDLAINISKVPKDLAVEWIVAAAKAMDKAPAASGKLARNLEVDSVLDEAVAEIFR